MDVRTIKQSWLYQGNLPDPAVLDALRNRLPPGRDREAAQILLEIAQGRPRLHDGETRHFLTARNRILLENSFSA